MRQELAIVLVLNELGLANCSSRSSDLTLAFSSTVTAREFHVLMILVLMLLTIYLCHSLIRLFMVASRRFGGASAQRRIVRRVGSSGYANPQQPIPVRLARDEEIAADEDRTDGVADPGPVAKPPPAYGRWRSSVVRLSPHFLPISISDLVSAHALSILLLTKFPAQRINPNMLYWQRVGSDRDPNPENSRQHDEDTPQASQNRPPSYISDDEIQYVVEMQPPHQMGLQLREPGDEFIHPAERNRIKS